MTRLPVVSDHAAHYGVKRLCRVLHLSRSGCYDWKSRPISTHAKRDTELAELIGEIHTRSRTT